MPRKRTVRHFLDDIIESIDAIRSYVAGLDEPAYFSNSLVCDAVERRLLIISEAVRNLPDDLTGTQPQVPWRQIRDIGNWLRHAYHSIQDHSIWLTITTDLDPLEVAIIAMIEASERQKD